jgi:hypothetical protein
MSLRVNLGKKKLILVFQILGWIFKNFLIKEKTSKNFSIFPRGIFLNLFSSQSQSQIDCKINNENSKNNIYSMILETVDLDANS